MIIKNVYVKPDIFTDKVSKAFDFEFTGKSTFVLPEFTVPTKVFNIGLIVGSSGSGKTQILRHYFNHKELNMKWYKNKAVISHFKTPEDAIDKMFAVGLSSIPSLCRPYHVLSNGEQFRANLARMLSDNATIDEFTSVVNRATAKSVSMSISTYIRRNNITGVVFSSCHRDIIQWLQPDWVFDCDSKRFSKNTLDLTILKKVAEIEIY